MSAPNLKVKHLTEATTAVQPTVNKSQAAQETAQGSKRQTSNDQGQEIDQQSKRDTTKDQDQEEDLLYVYSYCADI